MRIFPNLRRRQAHSVRPWGSTHPVVLPESVGSIANLRRPDALLNSVTAPPDSMRRILAPRKLNLRGDHAVGITP
jgi:hypothetical protein